MRYEATSVDAATMTGPARVSELTVVVPTFNERDNVAPLVELVGAALAGIDWEVIFVDDDSADGTAAVVRDLARRDPRVRCIQRIGRRGLSTACIEGVLASSSPFVAVMDADLQHDERLLPLMLEVLKGDTCDLVVGSRYVSGGSLGDWDNRRAGISGLATRLSRFVCKADIADPMSGFFMVRRGVFEGAVRRLSGQGFKILLDLLASAPGQIRLKELPYQFRRRRHGTSKLDTLVAWEFGMLLADKLVGHLVPVRFALFAFIGAIGLGVHLAVLRAALTAPTLGFAAAQAIATLVAMTFELLPQQPLHLSRSASARLEPVARHALLLSYLRRRRRRQRGHCLLHLCLRPCLVDRWDRRRRSGLGLELRRLLGLHLAPGLSLLLAVCA